MITRRRFLGAALGGAAALPFMRRDLPLFDSGDPGVILPTDSGARETLITILHTNDQHSHIDPLPQNDKRAGKGGIARRATLVKRVRAENPNTLLVDAGDAFQGTPYFNLFKGEVEYKTMSAVGYDVVTLGNHDFDNGVQALAAAMKFATFEFVSANYDVKGTAIESRVKPYTVHVLDGVRVGIFGLGINLQGLNEASTYRGITFLDPVQSARSAVSALRGSERCSLVICLSHMGYYPQPKGHEFGDSQLAASVDGIDFIVSGHTHTFMERPVLVRQPSGAETLIFQVGYAGVYVGRVDFTMRDGKIASATGRLLELAEA